MNKNETKLKTLKDITYENIDSDGNKLPKVLYDTYELRKVVEEWVKDIEKDCPSKFTALMSTVEEAEFLISWIKYFFNLEDNNKND